jgi:hypothetical protein
VGPIRGPEGPEGPDGPKGDDGTSVVIQGSVAEIADLDDIVNPEPGDLYIVIADGDGYVWDGQHWNDVGPIQGPEGPPGEKGDKGDEGDKGDQGDSISLKGSVQQVADLDNIQDPEVGDLYVVSTNGDGTTKALIYDLPINSTDFNTPSTPIIVTFDFIDDANSTIVFSSTPPAPPGSSLNEWANFDNPNEIIYIQFANLPAFSNAIQSYGVEIGAAEYGFKPLLSYGSGTGSASHTVSDLISNRLWTNNAVIAIRNTDSNFFTSPMAFTFYKDASAGDVMTVIIDGDGFV